MTEQYCWALGEKPLPVRNLAFLTFSFLFTSASDFFLLFVFSSPSDCIPSLFLSMFSLLFSMHPSHTPLPFFCIIPNSRKGAFISVPKDHPHSQQPGGLVPQLSFLQD